jgi:hypothetical protein
MLAPSEGRSDGSAKFGFPAKSVADPHVVELASPLLLPLLLLLEPPLLLLAPLLLAPLLLAPLLLAPLLLAPLLLAPLLLAPLLLAPLLLAPLLLAPLPLAPLLLAPPPSSPLSPPLLPLLLLHAAAAATRVRVRRDPILKVILHLRSQHRGSGRQYGPFEVHPYAHTSTKSPARSCSPAPGLPSSPSRARRRHVLS